MSAEPPATSEPVAEDPIGVRYPNTARIWNYQLGGKDNFAVDRAASDAANAMVSGLGVPAGTDTAVESRHLLQRMVDYMIGQVSASSLTSVPACRTWPTPTRSPTGPRPARALSTRTSTRWSRPMPPR